MIRYQMTVPPACDARDYHSSLFTILADSDGMGTGGFLTVMVSSEWADGVPPVSSRSIDGGPAGATGSSAAQRAVLGGRR